ncbi:hypothetical protein BMS3Abin04_01291 [bacterium BMS3Abin04]|nr:hypothetical protein BMS3Abin04_01291 [bacterium BMS3Abin04]
MQVSCITCVPASATGLTASSFLIPDCSQRVLVPLFNTSGIISGIYSDLLKTLIISGVKGISVKFG